MVAKSPQFSPHLQARFSRNLRMSDVKLLAAKERGWFAEAPWSSLRSSCGGSPSLLDGWMDFMENPSVNGWLGVAPWLRKPPHVTLMAQDGMVGQSSLWGVMAWSAHFHEISGDGNWTAARNDPQNIARSNLIWYLNTPLHNAWLLSSWFSKFGQASWRVSYRNDLLGR